MAKTDRGKELARVLVITKAGKKVAEPKEGAHVIEMKPGMQFRGDPEKAIAALEKSYPGCKFAWATNNTK